MDQGIISGTNFLTSLVIGRLLGKESLGMLFVSLGVFTVVQCVTDQLIHTPYLVRAPHFAPLRARQFSGSALLHTWCLTVVAMLLILGAAGLLQLNPIGHRGPLAMTLLLLAVLLPGMMLRDFIHNMLHNQLRQGEVVALDAAVSAVQLVALAAIAASQSLSITTALIAIGASSTLVGLWWLPSLLRNIQIAPGLAVNDFASNWPIGKWTLGSYLIGSSAPTVLPWFLVMSHGVEATGLLAACLALHGLAQTFLRGMGKYMAPQMSIAFAEGGREALSDSLRKFTFYSLLAMTLIAATLAVGGDRLVQLAYGGEYVGTLRIMQTLALGCWLQTLDVLIGTSLLALTLSMRNFWADCIRFAVTVLLAILLIPSWGGLGVAISMVAGMSAGLLCRVQFYIAAMGRLPDMPTMGDNPPVAVS